MGVQIVLYDPNDAGLREVDVGHSACGFRLSSCMAGFQDLRARLSNGQPRGSIISGNPSMLLLMAGEAPPARGGGALPERGLANREHKGVRHLPKCGFECL